MTSSRTRLLSFLAVSLVALSACAVESPKPQESTQESSKVGPGGGIIFFVAPTPFPCGAELKETCTYLEAAPDGWNGGDEDPEASWSGTDDLFVGVGSQIGLGYGYQNTLAAVAQDSTAGTAVTLADSYANNGKTDWFLPSKAELNELCKYARQQPTGDTSVACDSSNSLRSGFTDEVYWSSSETPLAPAVWYQYFTTGHQTNFNKMSTFRVRPVRAF